MSGTAISRWPSPSRSRAVWGATRISSWMERRAESLVASSISVPRVMMKATDGRGEQLALDQAGDQGQADQLVHVHPALQQALELPPR
jgi:hypothetical protein